MAFPASTNCPTTDNGGGGGVAYPVMWMTYDPPWQFSSVEPPDYADGYDEGYVDGFGDGGGGGGGVPTIGQTWPRGNP